MLFIYRILRVGGKYCFVRDLSGHQTKRYSILGSLETSDPVMNLPVKQSLCAQDKTKRIWKLKSNVYDDHVLSNCLIEVVERVCFWQLDVCKSGVGSLWYVNVPFLDLWIPGWRSRCTRFFQRPVCNSAHWVLQRSHRNSLYPSIQIGCKLVERNSRVSVFHYFSLFFRYSGPTYWAVTHFNITDLQKSGGSSAREPPCSWI